MVLVIRVPLSSQIGILHKNVKYAYNIQEQKTLGRVLQATTREGGGGQQTMFSIVEKCLLIFFC